MASCGEVDHSVNMLPSGRKLGAEACSGATSPALAVPECAICLQSCVHPVRLPCSHIFCFLCVKGASWQSKRCALCRQEIPEDFLERPTLLSPEELKAAGRGPGEHAWYYEGRNGWWQYDERTSRELEDAFSKGKKSTEMLIAGFLYVADLENMVQYRRNEHGRRRRMKRDVVDIPKKGVAGLRLDAELAGAQAAAGRESSADGADVSGSQAAGAPTPLRPPTTLGGQPGSPTTPSHEDASSLEDSLAQLQISPPAGQNRGPNGEGEEDGDQTAPNTSVDDSESRSTEEEVEEEEDEEEGEDEEDREDEEDGEDGQEVAEEGARSRQRLLQQERFGESHADRLPPGGESSTSSSVRSRRPDGQCSVTEV
ncbi:E3 ubiquitin-protein ligase rnf146-like [Megalops cyprinoides]|uniref:E3 ubiquitin-protein ligase rnf146-like n=1 Tax=Megalops cyprinoides TaxID=118141 RepID=UPI00186414CA|nr:E3 ubiquitin-protein ligase rnf146-like [Megalops cyprinoides]